MRSKRGSAALHRSTRDRGEGVGRKHRGAVRPSPSQQRNEDHPGAVGDAAGEAEDFRRRRKAGAFQNDGSVFSEFCVTAPKR